MTDGWVRINTGTTSSVTGNLVYTWADTSQAVREVGITKKEGIAPELYFKYVKSKFKLLERMRIDRRLKALERAFDQAVANGQEVLAAIFLAECVRETKESMMYAKGVRMFVEKDDLNKFKHKIRGGHISDSGFTLFRSFWRVGGGASCG